MQFFVPKARDSFRAVYPQYIEEMDQPLKYVITAIYMKSVILPRRCDILFISLLLSFTKLLRETLHFSLFLFCVVWLIRDKIFTGRKTKDNDLRLAVTFCLTATIRLPVLINDGYCPAGGYGIIPHACCRLWSPRYSGGPLCNHNNTYRGNVK